MCVCLGKTVTKDSICKCSHTNVRLMGERVVGGSIIRNWICDEENCYKAWDISMGFSSQEQLEGKV